ncbi:3-oxo-5-alpha-steroid 4-dehydrogenase-domain-containing protein [Pavlovales sp. CCMP2436]|nr:3-oxo-5-alpha-steroid 4-dehydrogenase-domain-containing protein [Pavlovales sp. CCMP2436]
MHLLAYGLGLSYYALLPAAPLAECTAPLREGGLSPGARRFAAVAVYAWGSLHQHRCHRILAELRGPGVGAARAYAVPYGDWFAHVSCPHYLAEILIYASLLVAKPRDRTLGCLLAWVVVGLAINAGRAHGWYRAAFAAYPRSRCALFPGL